MGARVNKEIVTEVDLEDNWIETLVWASGSNTLEESNEEIPIKGSIPSSNSTPKCELKHLPSPLKYDFLREKKSLPVIIASNLSQPEEAELIEVLRHYKGAIG
ncbi:hypothetical protein Dsin_005893 [Dipteronia sinensis]|uniref:Uncharacterized protein n=1 Tax=Dipteronia sinensis TaxID=43782 RepID=A0AAE0AXC6_9ROSI|nr:hypothetical protein Dsin_005893 [Dipteronia sinensis]